MRLPMLALYAAAVALAQANSPQSSRAEEPKGEIGGIVVSAPTGEPIRGALVSLRSAKKERSEEPPVYTITTGPDGRYRIGGLPEGDYEVWISKSGYDSRSSSALVVTLKDGQSLTDLVSKMWRPAVISGRVADADGRPVPKAILQAYRITYSKGQPQFRFARETKSDDLGEYRISGLPAGRYVVGLSVPQQRHAQGILEYEYAPVFYPQALWPSEGAVLKPAWGEELQDVSFRVSTPQDTLFGGVVVDGDTGVVCGSCRVRCVPAGVNLADPTLYSLNTRPDGAFAVRGLSPGSYWLVAESMDRFSRYAIEQLQVAAGGVQQVRLALTGGQTISGLEAMKPPAVEPDLEKDKKEKRDRMIVLSSAGGVTGGAVKPAPIDDETGRFRIQDVPPGAYVVQVAQLPEGSYLKSVSVWGQELAAPVITVGPVPIQDLAIRLSFDAAQVVGRVRAPIGNASAPPPKGLVALLPEISTGYLSEQYVPYNDDGSFQLNHVAPGSYFLFAMPARDSADLGNPEVRTALAQFGRRLEVSAKEQAVVEITLMPEPSRPL